MRRSYVCKLFAGMENFCLCLSTVVFVNTFFLLYFRFSALYSNPANPAFLLATLLEDYY